MMVPKGMKQVLIGRHINVKGMRAADMQRILSEMHDFKYEKTIEQYILGQKHRVLYIHTQVSLQAESN